MYSFKRIPTLVYPRVIGSDAECITAHQHVDNGGYTVTIDEHRNVVIEAGFFGYSTTTLHMSCLDLRGLVKLMHDASNINKQRSHRVGDVVWVPCVVTKTSQMAYTGEQIIDVRPVESHSDEPYGQDVIPSFSLRSADVL